MIRRPAPARCEPTARCDRDLMSFSMSSTGPGAPPCNGPSTPRSLPSPALTISERGARDDARGEGRARSIPVVDSRSPSRYRSLAPRSDRAPCREPYRESSRRAAGRFVARWAACRAQPSVRRDDRRKRAVRSFAASMSAADEMSSGWGDRATTSHRPSGARRWAVTWRRLATTCIASSGSARNAAISRRSPANSSRDGNAPRHNRWAASSKLTRPASSLSCSRR